MNRLENFEFNKISGRHIQAVCLLVTAVIEGLTLIFGRFFYTDARQYIVSVINIAAVIYFCVSIRRPMSKAGRKILLTGMAFALWHIALQLYDFLSHGQASAEGPRFICSTFFLEAVVILPYACLSDEKENLSGLKLFGWTFVFASGFLSILAALQCHNIIPGLFSKFSKWHNTYRLQTIWSPNILATVFLIGIAFLLIFLFLSKKKISKILFAVLAMAEYYFLVLTDSRGNSAAFIFMIAGIAMCLAYQKTEKLSAVKKVLITGLTGIISAVLLISAGNFILDCHIAHLDRTAAAGTEKAEYTDSACSDRADTSAAWNTDTDVAADAFSGSTAAEAASSGAADAYSYRQEAFGFINLGGRTAIWSRIISHLKHDGKIWLTGVKNVTEYIRSCGDRHIHAHNAWLQIFLQMGFVGLLFALYFTFITVKNSFILIFKRKSGIVQKAVCILSLAIMASQLMEIYIFSVDYPVNFINIVYFLCVGYEVQWVSQPGKQLCK